MIAIIRALKFIKALKAICPDSGLFWLDEDHEVFYPEEASGALGDPYVSLPRNEKRSAFLSYLLKSGFLEHRRANYYFLTYKGMHPYDFSAAAVLYEVVRSIVFPVIAAIITTLVTLWLTSL